MSVPWATFSAIIEPRGSTGLSGVNPGRGEGHTPGIPNGEPFTRVRDLNGQC